MDFSEDEEILQDFLLEAAEILEQLSEQLVELEQSPEDSDLLNAIFRGFHTVKGGAGFLQLTPLVDCCHVTENLFDLLRTGQRKVTPDLMDVVLQVLDAVHTMFDQLKNREELTPADPSLIARLQALVSGDEEALAAAKAAAEEKPAEVGEDEITEEEFEQLLDDLHGKNEEGGEAPAADTAENAEPAPSAQDGGGDDLFDIPASSESSGNEITEEEFEAMLNSLQSKKNDGDEASTAEEVKQEQQTSESDPSAIDEITEDEFEALLDQLHGHGKKPTAATSHLEETSDAETQAEPEPAPEPVAKQAKAKPEQKSKQEPKQEVKAKAEAKPAPAAKPAEAAAAKAPADGAAKKTGAAAAKDGQMSLNAETTVRVDTKRLDEIMNMVGELVLVRNRLVRIGLNSGDEVMSKAVSNLDVVTADLQTSVMKTRMQPIKKVFGRFPRVVRDLARNLRKEISLELKGEDTDLDKNLVEALADPLVHLVRNSVDHGIELPEDREAKGKPRMGTVILAAEQEGDHILLSITDDGNGMDPEKLKDRAVEKGLYDRDAVERLNPQECFDLIFAPGFSTKEEISDVSGRGVGMDVVKTKITQLNGSVVIHSDKGKGTRIEIKVPLTLAIMPTLMVMVGEQTFALPLVSVNEIFHTDLTRTNVVDGQQVITVRDKALPLFHLQRWLVARGGVSATGDNTAHVVIVSVGTQRVGFVVDQLIGQEEVVIKPLGKMLHGTPGMAGATITGDGRIALILDVPSLLKRYAG